MPGARAISLALCAVLAACSSGATEVDVAKIVTISANDVASPMLPASVPVPGGTAVSEFGSPTRVKDPQRIIAVASGVAETIAALGMANALVGRDIASQGPLLTRVPVVTDAHALAAERTLALRPTLLIIDAMTGPKTAISAVARAGVQVVTLPQAWTVEAAKNRIHAVASLLGVPQRADELIAKMHGQERFALRPKPRVAFLYVRGSAAVYLVGGKGSGADSLIDAAGAVDVGATSGLKAFTPLTPEILATLKPDVLLVMTKGMASVGGATGLFALPGVAQTPAAKFKRAIAVDDGLLLAFGPSTVSLVKALHQALNAVTHE
ncbi:MAG: ABC transporter substrate-binding protein [Actinobacteria bacterium]|nr:ABC transporter substrate-binding protein [Actinomycetota bacterium]